MTRISVDLIQSDSEIRKLILTALAEDVNKSIQKTSSSVDSKIKDLVKKALMNQPEFAALTTGQLRYELGINNTDSVLKVVNALAETSEIKVKPFKITSIGLSGGFQYNMMDTENLGGILYTDIASVQDSKGYSLPWLEWLLFEGGKPIVKNYEVKFGPSKFSRTGFAIMVKSNKNWRVPAQFAGTVTNNWITRALDTIDDEMNEIIENAFENSI